MRTVDFKRAPQYVASAQFASPPTALEKGGTTNVHCEERRDDVYLVVRSERQLSKQTMPFDQAIRQGKGFGR